jgi:hypothetical protein
LLWSRITAEALCAVSDIDPDRWFPASVGESSLRREAAPAVAVCAACRVRVECLHFALRNWNLGQHGIWGGLLPDERQALRSEIARRLGIGRGGETAAS